MLTIPASLLAVVFLTLVALFHLLRIAFGVEVIADGRTIPVWLSVFGVLVPGTLALLLWRERRSPGEPASADVADRAAPEHHGVNGGAGGAGR